MINRAVKEEIPEILGYLDRDTANCIYMYVDIGTYGLDNPAMKVWIERNSAGEIDLVIMKYYNSLQLFSADDTFDTESCAELVRIEDVPVINARYSLLEKIMPFVPGYELEHGIVYRCGRGIEREAPFCIERARDNDFGEIAELICSAETFAHYEPETLAVQLKERASTGMGRNLVIRKDGTIIAHIATFAEYRDVAVTSGLVVREGNGDFPYGTYLENYLFRELSEEGKRVYTFVTGRMRVKLLDAMGFPQVADYGKMKKIRN